MVKSLNRILQTIRQRRTSSQTPEEALAARAARKPYAGRTVTEFTSEAASETNLRFIIDILEEEGIDYFLVPGHAAIRHVVGISVRNRQRFLKLLSVSYADEAIHVGVPSGRSTFSLGPFSTADGELPHELQNEDVLRAAQIQFGPQGQVLAGFEHGCDIEFWAEGSELRNSEAGLERLSATKASLPVELHTDTWVGPRPNTVSDVLPAEARREVRTIVGEGEYRTFEDFADNISHDVPFPIDVVYTWVDGDDPQWRAKKAHHLGEEVPEHHRADSRYKNHDELKYSLRSLEMYAPFVRNVYLVTDGQCPPWLDTNECTLIDHKVIFADSTALPTFNSHAIGSQLHHIPGLAEHFLYFNDDALIGRRILPEVFFEQNGLSRLMPSSGRIGLGPPLQEEPAPNSAGKNVRELLRRDFGVSIANKFRHTPIPQLRSVSYELEERYQKEVGQTMRSRFRHVDDIGFCALLHQHYAYLTSRAIMAGEARCAYVNIADLDAPDRLDEISEKRLYDFICLNDVNTPPERREEVGAIVRSFCEVYFPFPSKYEKTDVCSTDSDRS
ncbi:stealth family protein [Haloglycomyces albus]|uniref:stealth family protein n=1 Tax=Haloglycomyces albus TaxID=526067 RepID=UPI00046CB787|nr:stealth family protein [Haloglycomyces albus]